ncbi:major facilitator superfamily domain-containing protein 12 isoform X2 [Parasteatoda tepidariorum]|uniref:major facilitator superfamily domain-containing protein 12 isoform X2 n=1 Tax=Parasteatoda tepidariorum TaxID=114398 RepID=UPI0039BC55FF
MDVASISFSGSRQPVKHVIPLGRRLAYSCGHVLNDLCASMWFSYLLIFEHSVLNLSNFVAGSLMLLGQIADGISTPFVGFESDQPNDMFLCRKYGRRKAWHLVGTICVIFSFPFLFMDCISCSNSFEYAKFIYYGAFIIIFQFGWASTQISHLSLIPDLTPLSCERVELNSYRYAMTVASNICVYTTLLIVLGVASGEDSHIGPTDLHIFRVAILYTSTRLFFNISQVYMPMYIQDTLKLHKSKIAIIPLVIFLSGFLSSFIVKFINRHFGSKITYLIGCILGLGACVWIHFGEGETYCQYELYGVAVLIGVAGSTLLIMSLGITSDLIANSTTSGAFVFGCMSFLDKLSNGVAVELIQVFHPCLTCCTSCRWYYRYILEFACGGAILLGLISLACLATQSIGERRNEEQLHRNSIIRHNRRVASMTSAKERSFEERRSLLDDESDSVTT